MMAYYNPPQIIPHYIRYAYNTKYICIITLNIVLYIVCYIIYSTSYGR